LSSGVGNWPGEPARWRRVTGVTDKELGARKNGWSGDRGKSCVKNAKLNAPSGKMLLGLQLSAVSHQLSAVERGVVSSRDWSSVKKTPGAFTAKGTKVQKGKGSIELCPAGCQITAAAGLTSDMNPRFHPLRIARPLTDRCKRLSRRHWRRWESRPRCTTTQASRCSSRA
jgi:hypothetical protein